MFTIEKEDGRKAPSKPATYTNKKQPLLQVAYHPLSKKGCVHSTITMFHVYWTFKNLSLTIVFLFHSFVGYTVPLFLLISQSVNKVSPLNVFVAKTDNNFL